MEVFTSLSESVIFGKEAEVKDQIKALVDSGANPLDIIVSGLIAGMSVVGSRFKNGEMFVPEVLMSAKAMASGIELLKPLIAEEDIPTCGTVLIGTVKGDLHDIGKNLVAMMLESARFKVINLGVNVPAEVFAAKIKETRADVLGMSALLTTTMLQMKDTIEVLKEEGLRDKIKVIVGGAPLSKEFADEIGADGFAPEAASASDLCKKLLGI